MENFSIHPFFSGFLKEKEINFAATADLAWDDKFKNSATSEYTTLKQNLASALSNGFKMPTILDKDFIKIEQLSFTKISDSKTGVTAKITHSANALPDMYDLLDKLVDNVQKEKNHFIFGSYKLLINSVALNDKKVNALPSIVTFKYEFKEEMKDLASAAAKNVSKKIIDNLTPVYQKLYGNSFAIIILALFPGSVQASTLVTVAKEPLSTDQKDKLYNDLVDHAKTTGDIDETRVTVGEKSTGSFGNATLITLNVKGFTQALSNEQETALRSGFEANVPKLLLDNGITITSMSVQSVSFQNNLVPVTFEVRSLGVEKADIEKVFKENNKIGSYEYQNDKIEANEGYDNEQKLLFEGNLNYTWSSGLSNKKAQEYIQLSNELSQEFKTAFSHQSVLGDNFTTSIEYKFYESTTYLNKTDVVATIIHKYKNSRLDVYQILHNLLLNLSVENFNVKFGSKVFTLSSIKLDRKTINIIPSVIAFNYEFKPEMLDRNSKEFKDLQTKVNSNLNLFYATNYPNTPTKVMILALHKGSVIVSNLVTLARSNMNEAERNNLFDELVNFAKNNSNIDASRIATLGKSTASFGIQFDFTIHFKDHKNRDTNELKKGINEDLHKRLFERGFTVTSVKSESLTKKDKEFFYTVRITGFGLNTNDVIDFIKTLKQLNGHDLGDKDPKVKKVEPESDNKVLYIVIGVICVLVLIVLIVVIMLCLLRRRIETRDQEILSSDQQSSVYGGYNYPRPSRRHWLDTDSSLGSGSELGQNPIIPRPKIGHGPESRVEQSVDWDALRRQTKMPQFSRKSEDSRMSEHGPTGWVSFK